MLLPLASADLVSRVELTDAGSLAEDDLGIKVGAVSPSGEDILIAGMNGYAHLLSAKEADNRDMDIELVTGKMQPSTTLLGTLEETRPCWSAKKDLRCATIRTITA